LSNPVDENKINKFWESMHQFANEKRKCFASLQAICGRKPNSFLVIVTIDFVDTLFDYTQEDLWINQLLTDKTNDAWNLFYLMAMQHILVGLGIVEKPSSPFFFTDTEFGSSPGIGNNYVCVDTTLENTCNIWDVALALAGKDSKCTIDWCVCRVGVIHTNKETGLLEQPFGHMQNMSTAQRFLDFSNQFLPMSNLSAFASVIHERLGKQSVATRFPADLLCLVKGNHITGQVAEWMSWVQTVPGQDEEEEKRVTKKQRLF